MSTSFALKELDNDIFRQIFLDHWENFKKRYSSYNTLYYEEVIQKMLGCGKEEGGFVEYRCPHCGQGVHRVAFTCKSCFCLSCSKVYTDNFVSQMSHALRPGVTYRHMILTTPQQLKTYFYQNRHDGSLLSALMRCGHACLEQVVSIATKQNINTGQKVSHFHR